MINFSEKLLCEIEFQLDYFEIYISEVESNFDETARIIEGRYSDREDNFLNLYINNHWMYEQLFPRFFRESASVSILSFFENSLKEICIQHCIRYLSPNRYDNLKGKSNIRGFKQYLSTECKIEFSTNEEWSIISNYISIRNTFVHNGGEISRNDRRFKAISAFVQRHPSLEFELKTIMQLNARPKYSERIIIIDKDYNLQLVEILRLFFRRLLGTDLIIDRPPVNT